MTNQQFCKFFRNGLVYNNDTVNFTASPCCYYKDSTALDPMLGTAEKFNEIRDSWSNDNPAIVCQICTQLENSGLNSYRHGSFDMCSTDSDNIEILTIAVNKQCNLACASCSAESSSFWYQENLRNGITPSEKIINLHRDDKQGLIVKRFIDLLKTQNLSKLKYIKFGGGEPLINKTHELILEMIPFPENVTVQYTSNFSIMPSQHSLKLWEKFKLIKWVASVDAINDQFEILRWPYKWKNFTQFQQKAWVTVPGNVMFGIEHTLNPLNIYYFDQFEQWFNQVFCILIFPKSV